MSSPNPKFNANSQSEKREQEVLSALRGISYGSIEVIIHNREIVQIVRTERHRIGSQKSDEQ